MLEKPLITVGITCFNAGDTIRRAIDSALAQTWPRKEVVVVDDGSSDRSLELIREIASRNPEVSVVRHSTNLGYPAALNSLLRRAKGEFIAIFDDDDENAPYRILAQYERLVSYEEETGAELVFCYSNRYVVKPGEVSADHVALAIGRTSPEPYGPSVVDYLLAIDANPRFVWGMFGSCTLMARRESFLKVGMLDESFRRSAEWDMAIRAAFLGAHFIAVDRPLVTQYKTRSPDKSGNLPLKYALKLRDKYRPYLQSRGAYYASRMLARSNFHGNKKRYWKSRFWQAVAFALSPTLLSTRLFRRHIDISR